jgi:DUF1680 family protein
MGHWSNRRAFLVQLGAIACAAIPMKNLGALSDPTGTTAASDSTPPPAAAITNRIPLAANAFYPLRLGSVRPIGWLRRQLQIQANGLGGHLDETWPDVGPNSGWLGGTGESWERGPYFLDGLVALAYLLDDPGLKAKVQKYIDWTLSNAASSGMIGPKGNDDWWPRMVMLKVLTQYQEATGDARVIPLMERYFAFQNTELPKRPLDSWGKYRWQDEILSVLWLYNRTGNSDLLQTARLLHDQGYEWRLQFENFQYKDKQTAAILNVKQGTPLKNRAMETHGVNNAMGLKSSAVWWLFSQNPADRAGATRQLAMLDEYHGIPNGMFSADEHYSGRNPSQGIELCAVVEQMFSLEQALAILGDPLLGDRLERIAFNALPGAFTDDMWAHQYDQQPNQIQCNLRQRPWSTNGPESNLYGLEPNFGCCTANLHQGWPKLTASLWMSDGEGGLVAGVYAPSEVHATVGGGIPVLIEEDTMYPFRGDIKLSIRPDKPVRFPLRLRIPIWAEGSTVRVNGRHSGNPRAGSFAVLEREWQADDKIEINFPLKPRLTRGYNQSVTVERGPLVFSLGVTEEWEKLRTRGMTADWAVNPKSPWNYALAVNEHTAESVLNVVERSSGNDLFTLEGAPVRIQARGKRVLEWREEDGVAAPVPESPVRSNESVETLTLVPYAAAKLRITAFPELLEPPALKTVG